MMPALSSFSRRLMALAGILGLVATAGAWSSSPAGAAATGKSYTVAVLGDSLADGLYAGLRTLTRDMPNVSVKKYSRVNTGIARADRYNWNSAAEQIASSNVQIAVMVFGANDLQSIRLNGKAYHYPQPGWVKLYKERVDGIVRSFKQRHIPVYWVGLPITRKDRFQKDYAFLNTIFRAIVRQNGGTFVDTWQALADDSGAYSAYHVVDGKKSQIRASDGVHFTPVGYQIYADYALRKIKTDFSLPSAK